MGLRHSYGDCLRRFKSDDFDVEDKEGQNWLKMQNWRYYSMKKRKTYRIIGSCSINHLHIFKSIGNDSKTRKRISYELKPRDLEMRFFRCELLLQRQKRKNFLQRIVIGNEKWIHYNNPKHKKSWGKPGYTSTSTAKPNIHGPKLMFRI